MHIYHCDNCEKEMGHKRALGIGTLLVVIFTGGLWLLAIPFYPERCIACGNKPESSLLLDLLWCALMELPLIILFIMILKIFGVAFAETYGDFDNVEFVSCYDGDTCFFNIPGVHPLLGKRIGVRLRGVDAPEIRGKCEQEKELAVKSRDFVTGLLSKSKSINITDGGDIRLENTDRDKYFRILANITADGNDISKALIKNKLAVPYEGGKRINWCNERL